MAKKRKAHKKWEVTAPRFVAIIDIMGFKDMVARNPHKIVFERMQKLAETQNLIDLIYVDESDGQMDIMSITFSDSIMIFSVDDSKESFENIANCTSYVVNQAIFNNIPMKGAIAHGEISADRKSQIYFGQPIIDAHLLQEELNYYGVVAHFSVDQYIKNNPTSNEEKNFVEINTPFKSGMIVHSNLDWLSGFDANAKVHNLPGLHEYLRNLKLTVSGHPRKYVDNTIEVFKLIRAVKTGV
jgi:hypothetical protein